MELKVLRMENNWKNVRDWSVVVDSEGKAIEGGFREAVRMGLVTEMNRDYHCWGLRKMANGDINDYWSYYGEQWVVYEIIVNGVPV